MEILSSSRISRYSLVGKKLYTEKVEINFLLDSCQYVKLGICVHLKTALLGTEYFGRYGLYITGFF